jgi:hypothetical protein
MSTSLARPSVWRLWWSFTWRQAAAMTLASLALGVVVAVLREFGFPRGWIYNAMPALSFILVVYSGYEACRRLLLIYDIRLHGAHHDEQNHRHRR